MKRASFLRLFAVFAAGFILFSVSGCGNGSDGGHPDDPVKPGDIEGTWGSIADATGTLYPTTSDWSGQIRFSLPESAVMELAVAEDDTYTYITRWVRNNWFWRYTDTSGRIYEIAPSSNDVDMSLTPLRVVDGIVNITEEDLNGTWTYTLDISKGTMNLTVGYVGAAPDSTAAAFTYIGTGSADADVPTVSGSMTLTWSNLDDDTGWDLTGTWDGEAGTGTFKPVDAVNWSGWIQTGLEKGSSMRLIMDGDDLYLVEWGKTNDWILNYANMYGRQVGLDTIIRQSTSFGYPKRFVAGVARFAEDRYNGVWEYKLDAASDSKMLMTITYAGPVPSMAADALTYIGATSADANPDVYGTITVNWIKSSPNP